MAGRRNRAAVAVAAIACVFCSCTAPSKYQADQRSIDELVDDLSTSSDEQNRVAAAQRLGELGDRNGEFALLPALRDPAAGVRESAVKALAEIKDPRAVEPLCTVLVKDIDRRTRIAAAGALATLQDTRAIGPLAHALQDIGEYAASALAALGQPGIAQLVEAVKNAETRDIAGSALVSVGAPAIGPLIDVLHREPGRYARAAAARVLSQIGGDRADDALTEALQRNEPEMVAAAYRFLIRRGQSGTESLLVRALNLSGDLEMASDFTNCGNDVLKSGAAQWAANKHYLIPRTEVDDKERPRWGKPLPVVRQLAVFHYDNSPSSASGILPLQAEKTSFAPGRWGSALAIAPGGILTYPVANNLDFGNGTIELWIAPRHEGSDPVYSKYKHTLLLYSVPPNYDQFIVAESGRSFYAGTVVGTQFSGAGGGDISSWKAGQWHHVAFTYSAVRSRQRWYIDGVLTREHTGSMPVLGASGGKFAVDCDFWGRASDFFVDELRILNQEQTLAAVLQDAMRTSPFGSETAPHTPLLDKVRHGNE
jgi:HEAT repeat protein